MPLVPCPLKVDVVEAAYSVLRNTLGAVEDFVTLQKAHQEFLNTVKTKFYVDNIEISQVTRRLGSDTQSRWTRSIRVWPIGFGDSSAAVRTKAR